MPHNGVDFAAPTGTPIYAAASGTVKTAGDSGPCGNMVQIEHNAGIISSYCHMSRFAAGVHVGEHVDTRQLIGYVGHSSSSGSMTTTQNGATMSAATVAAVLRALHGVRILLLLEIDGCRFVNMAPNVNLGVRELGQNFTNRTGLAG